MPQDVVFTLQLESELHVAFMVEAEAAHRPADDILRDLMRDFVQRQSKARAYEDFLRRKVEASRAAMRAGRGIPNDEVEAEFAARRARITNQGEGILDTRGPEPERSDTDG